MACKKCGAINPEQARFCQSCGNSLDVPAQLANPALATAVPPRPGTKVAAVCVWIVSAVLAVVGFTAFGPSPEEIRACISVGGSGSTCPLALFPAQLFWLLAIIGAGYGAKLWAARN